MSENLSPSPTSSGKGEDRKRDSRLNNLKALVDKKNYSMDGLELLKAIPDNKIAYCIFDPQYDHLQKYMKIGNTADEGRLKKCRALPPQGAMDLWKFGQQIARVLRPSGHVSLWMDTYILADTSPLDIFKDDNGATVMNQVAVITWDKQRMGMGYRVRSQSEFLVTYQKDPKKAKGCWNDHAIPSVWGENVTKTHPHSKPVGLQARMIACLTQPNEIVLDPTAGGFSVMEAAHKEGRRYLGCEFLPEGDPALKP